MLSNETCRETPSSAENTIEAIEYESSPSNEDYSSLFNNSSDEIELICNNNGFFHSFIHFANYSSNISKTMNEMSVSFD